MTHELNDGKPEKIHSIDQIDKGLLKEGTVRLDKSLTMPHPTNWGWGLEENDLGFSKGANEVYRSSESRDTIQVREYDDYFLIQLDHAHPAENPVAHFKYDLSPGQKTGLTIGALAVGALIFGSFSG